MISENTKIRLSLLVTMMGGLGSSLIWVGNIQADVSKLKDERLELSKKVDSIKENTDYMRGLMDSARKGNK